MQILDSPDLMPRVEHPVLYFLGTPYVYLFPVPAILIITEVKYAHVYVRHITDTAHLAAVISQQFRLVKKSAFLL